MNHTHRSLSVMLILRYERNASGGAPAGCSALELRSRSKPNTNPAQAAVLPSGAQPAKPGYGLERH